MKKILITGVSSYIGTSFERWVSQFPGDYAVDSVSVRDDGWRERSFAAYDVIFHTAALVHSDERDIGPYLKVNRDLTIELAKKAKKEGTAQFIFLSTMGVYGTETGYITKDTVPAPKTPYAKSKYEAEKLLLHENTADFHIAILRPPIVYGRGCPGNYAKLAAMAGKLPFFPKVCNERSMIYMDNLSEFIRLLMESGEGGIFFPQNKDYVNTSELVSFVAQARGRKVRLTGLFNWGIKLISLRSGSMRKVFGSFVYDKKMSLFPEKSSEANEGDYEVVTFRESIMRTEGKEGPFMDQQAKHPCISIIMPAYNCAHFIKDAITSVIRQTYPNWELLVIDDGSMDHTRDVIADLAEKDARIRFYANEANQGVSRTRNRGISLAAGDWIAFLDSDDMWTETKLEKQLDYAVRQGASFVFTGSSFIHESGVKYEGIFQVPELVDYKALRTHNMIICSSVLVRKKLVEQVKMERDDMHEDYAVWLRILKQGIAAYGLNEPLLLYRISKTSKSGNKVKTLKMTYRVYRFIGLDPMRSIYYLCRHIAGAAKKYKGIKMV